MIILGYFREFVVGGQAFSEYWVFWFIEICLLRYIVYESLADLAVTTSELNEMHKALGFSAQWVIMVS